MWRKRSRRHPQRFTRVFSVDIAGPDAVEKMRHGSVADSAASRLFTTGSTMPDGELVRDPRSYPAGNMPARPHTGLHADDPGGLSAIARPDGALSRRPE